MHFVDQNLDRLQSVWREIGGSFRRINDNTPLHRLTLSHIERRFKKFRKGLGKPKTTISKERFWRGSLLLLAAIATAFVAVMAIFTRLTYMPYDVIYFIGAVVTWVVVVLLGVAGVIFAAWLWHLARAMLYPGVEDLLKVDKRQPIVFLRSFDDDYVQFEQDKIHWTSFMHANDKSEADLFLNSLQQLTRNVFAPKREVEVKEPGIKVEKLRFEHVIHKQLKKLGPVIAIGRPGDKLPNLAAAREHFGDAEWKEAILGWLDRARMIVVVAGFSEGIKWEIDQIEIKGYRHKVLVLLPPKPIRLVTSFGQLWENWKQRNADHRRERWTVVCEKFAPEVSRRALRRVDVDQLIGIHLTSDGQPVLIRCKKHTASAYQLALRVAAYGMLCRQNAVEGAPAVHQVPVSSLGVDRAQGAPTQA